MVEIKLKKGKEKAVYQRHPWVFSGALDKVKGKPENGDVVRLIDANGDFLAYGYYNDQSRVAVRLIEWNEETTIDEAWYEQKIKTAIAGRAHLLADKETTACRLVFSEAALTSASASSMVFNLISILVNNTTNEVFPHC